ncbi:MAG: hypothetical protein C4570_04285 [Ammonifex sp.]|nr:MAG: hypothetical protein C4570_04285 [Ammonifex sp.]
MSRDTRSIDKAVRYAWSYVGHWYKWGGDDPAGFDCSGFGGEIMQATGRIHSKIKMSAAQIFEKFKDKVIPLPIVGALLFVEKAGRIVHMEFCLDDETSIGASGGGPETTTLEKAIQANAFIKPRPIFGRWEGPEYRLRFVDPFQED